MPRKPTDRSPRKTDVPPYDASPRWWAQLLGQLTLRAIGDPSTANLQLLRAVNSATVAFEKVADLASYEARIDELQKLLEEITASQEAVATAREPDSDGE